MALYINTSLMARNAERSLNVSYGFISEITERLLSVDRTNESVAVSLSNRVAADIAATVRQLNEQLLKNA